MDLLVQKFGGTSVQNLDKMNIVCNIIESYKKNYNLVVVVSAMGRKGDPYATDTLINIANNDNTRSSKRELDMLMSCGEIISGTVLSQLLNEKGIPSVFLNGAQAGIVTDGNFGEAKIVTINPERIYKEIADNKVVVVAGFQGISHSGEITTLGRGGSDTSAVALGKALNCKNIEIYTDVDGIMTADPRVVSDAKILSNINYEEVFQMAEKGAKVIHPRAVELARSGGLNIIIKNTLNPEAEGTVIGNFSNNNIFETQNLFENNSNLVIAVANKNDLVQFKGEVLNNDCFIQLLEDFKLNAISIDMINFFENFKAFVIDAKNKETAQYLLEKNNIDMNIRENCVKVTIIGSKITGIPGVMSQITNALHTKNITVYQTSDSSSTISCLVDYKDATNALKILHSEFIL